MQRFEPVDPKVSFPELERRILEFWSEHDVFARSIELRKDDPLWVFYEGPPTANGTPGHPSRRGARLQGRLSAVQDDDRALRAAQGRVGLPRPAGRARGREGDRHHRQARHRGVRDRRVQPAVPGVGDPLRRRVRTAHRAHRLLDRHVRRVLDDEHRVHRVGVVVAEAAARRGLLVEADKVTAYCPRCGTALSDAEVAMGYQTVEDPSVFVRFRVAAGANDGAQRPSRASRSWCGRPRRGRFRPTRASPSTARASYVVVDVDGELLVVGAALRERVLGEDGERGRDAPRIRPRRGPLRAAVSERRGGARGGRRRLRLDGRRHRDRAHRPRVRPRGPRDRPRAGLAGLQAGRRRGAVQRPRRRRSSAGSS